MFSLDGKVAVVTGGASGIGRGTSILLAERGAKVLVVDVDDQKGRETVEMTTMGGSDGKRASFFHADVSKVSDVKSMIGEAIARYGGLEILFNNAGIDCQKGSLDTTEDQYERTLDTNLKSVFFGCKYAAEWMKEKGGGTIVSTSSVNAVSGSADLVAYAASKGGILSMTTALAKEYAPFHIRVNCILPGPIETSIGANSPWAGSQVPPPVEETIGRTLLKRIGTPMDVAFGVLYLVSDEASFVTGTALVVDGGWLAAR
jgi:meso-butanediol dehydrogenase / (S,S)-butanediol dehydrogenase / diacetyl reductase